jgi:hypothetical protein
MSDLVGLARRYVALSDQLETVRSEIAKAVLNGGGGAGPNPIRPTRSSGGSQPQRMVVAQAEEERILALLKDRPGMRCKELAALTMAKRNTVSQRLQRLRDRGVIEQLDGREGGWQAAAAAG